MSPDELNNRRAQSAWDANARFWDARMGEGNDFFEQLIWPASERLLAIRARERILDIACGNGLTSRRLAAAGAEVVAFDFSAELVRLAIDRSAGAGIDYRVLDATDAEALRRLGAGSFDAALCNMAFMDMADIEPLTAALAELLRPQGRFVFSLTHPCFNNPSTVQMGEIEDRDGTFAEVYSVKISRYMTSHARLGLAMHGQPVPHPYFHRSLGALLAPAFAAGLVLDALEERAFPPQFETGTTPLSWSGRFSEIPPVLVGRLRRSAV